MLPLKKEFKVYEKNRNNIKKILKSRILNDNSDTNLLPVAFPEKPAGKTDFPENAGKIYCDGCLNKYGNGGWAYLILNNTDNNCIINSGSEINSDSCRMELSAVVKGIQNIDDVEVIIHTDSRYVKHGIEAWLPVWQLNNYTTATNKEAKNRDLWEILSKLNTEKTLYWKWIKSRSGNFLHDSCHNEARTAADKCSIEDLFYNQ